MRRAHLLILLLILCISLPAVSGFAYRTDVGGGLDNFVVGSRDSWNGVEVSREENISGTNKNDVSFSLGSLVPGCRQAESWTVYNSNSFECYLDLERINIISNENGIMEPEIDAGDTTPDMGEMQDAVIICLFIDRNDDGFCDQSDTVIYDGPACDIAGAYDLNECVAAGSRVQIAASFDWIDTADCNAAMGDDLLMDLTFELSQTAGQ